MSDLLQIAKRVDDEISAIKQAFGAPGDYGYDSREGRALYRLYLFQNELRAALAESKNI